MANGTVYLIGAGPGDPELLTLKAHRILQQAEVVVFDRLVHPDILAMAPRNAERIHVGKNPHGPSVSQSAINHLLISRAMEGRLVVRLKGGDPYLFGRGAEEAGALEQAGISCVVVPGISSALAAPAAAGIPLTLRGVSSHVLITTAHRETGESTDWRPFARLDATLVVLMGMSALPAIADQLIAYGKDPQTPTAVVHRAGWPEQQVVRAPLFRIAATCARMGIGAPSVIVIGSVANLATGSPTTDLPVGLTDWLRAAVPDL